VFVLFGLAILAGWVGWGVLVARVVLGGAAARRLGWGMEAALGIAGLLPVGGALDHAGLVTPAALWALLIVGWAALAWRLVERRRRAASRERRAVVWAIPLAIGAFVACGWIACQEANAFLTDLWLVAGYNGHDDLQAYVVFALKMFHTGTQGLEPFSERRVLVPGGQAFLQCFALLSGSDLALNVIDPGLCLVVVAGLFAELLRGLGAPRRALLVVVPLVVVAPKVNTSALFSGMALYLALFRALDPRDELARGARGAVVVALISAGLMSLKVSFVAPLGLCLLVHHVGQAVVGRSPRPLQQLASSAALSLAFLAPWMASSMESCGTLLYPFLGRGHHTADYMGDVRPSAALLGVLRALSDQHALALLGSGAVAIAVTRGERRVACASLLGSALTAKAALFLANGLYSQRYTFSFTFAAFLFLLSCAATGLLASRGAARPGARGQALGGAVLLAALLALVFEQGLGAPARYLRELAQRLTRPTRVEPELARLLERARLAKVQAAVPAGEVLLARLEQPHLLDFTRTRIYVIDLPGGASPPPGLPLDQGPDALAEYLLGQSVRYVAYDYVREAGFPASVYRPVLGHPSLMIRGQTERALTFQRLLMELVPRRRIVFDDGLTFVMDLAPPP
jgi:hypothetical protein